MQPNSRTARLAGALYILAGLPGVYSLIYVPSKLIVGGDPAATAARILGSEMLFRAGMAAELVNAIGFLFVVRTLYQLLSTVDESKASLMVTLWVISVPISCLNVLNDTAALALFHSGDNAMAMMFLRLHSMGLQLAAIFWGLWLFPFGILVMRSGFIPRILGVLLIINGFAYPAVTLTAILFPEYVSVVNRIAMIAETGEVWIVLWLLIFGVRRPRTATAPQ